MKKINYILILLVIYGIFVFGCAQTQTAAMEKKDAMMEKEKAMSEESDAMDKSDEVMEKGVAISESKPTHLPLLMK